MVFFSVFLKSLHQKLTDEKLFSINKTIKSPNHSESYFDQQQNDECITYRPSQTANIHQSGSTVNLSLSQTISFRLFGNFE